MADVDIEALPPPAPAPGSGSGSGTPRDGENGAAKEPGPAAAAARAVTVRDRIAHFTWANFTCTQSTGGIAILLSETPHQFRGQRTAGAVVFVLNLALLALFSAAMAARFALHPGTLRRSLTRPPELFFAGSFFLSLATVVICAERFGAPRCGPWLVVAVRALFWAYAAASLLYTTGVFVAAFARAQVDPLRLSPAAFLMVFSSMLTGTVAASVAERQPPPQRLAIIVAGVAFQGLGWVLSLMLLPWFVGSLFRHGLGAPRARPSVFMPVGSAGYTIVSLIGCSRYLPDGYGYLATHPAAAEALRAVALWTGVFLWLFTFWLSALGVLACLPTALPHVRGWRLRPRMGFVLSWWAIIFPNVGFTIATGFIGEELESPAIQWVATAMAIVLFAAWLMDLGLHLKAILTGQIMWPGKDEDFTK